MVLSRFPHIHYLRFPASLLKPVFSSPYVLRINNSYVCTGSPNIRVHAPRVWSNVVWKRMTQACPTLCPKYVSARRAKQTSKFEGRVMMMFVEDLVGLFVCSSNRRRSQATVPTSPWFEIDRARSSSIRKFLMTRWYRRHWLTISKEHTFDWVSLQESWNTRWQTCGNVLQRPFNDSVSCCILRWRWANC